MNNLEPLATLSITDTEKRQTKQPASPHKKTNKNKQTYKQIKNTQHNTEKLRKKRITRTLVNPCVPEE